MKLSSYGLSDIGRSRTCNQDTIYLDPEMNLFIVADGMGGHSAGDMASQLSVKNIINFMKENSSLPPEKRIRESLLFANKEICDYAKKNDDIASMGTTVLLLFFAEQQLYIANVGDSRSCLIFQKKIYQLTRDHSLIQAKMDLEIYTRKEAAKDSQKNILVRTIGYSERVDVDIFQYTPSPYDIFICASDGLYDQVSDSKIIATVNELLPDPEKAREDDLKNLVKTLIDLSNTYSGNDNISVIVILVG